LDIHSGRTIAFPSDSSGSPDPSRDPDALKDGKSEPKGGTFGGAACHFFAAVATENLYCCADLVPMLPMSAAAMGQR
jgi:hypothetical protein